MRVLSFSLGLVAAAAQVVIASPDRLDDSSLVKTAGDAAAIKGWYLQSTAETSSDMLAISQPGFDVSSWYRVGSRGTVMAGLLENNVYNDTALFFSDNLKTMVDRSQFDVPWLYREELTFDPATNQRYFLETHGISSKADLYLNGKQLASKETLTGAYGGEKFDITQYLLKGKNAVLIRAYPTNYLKDFALGYVDWNPYPPDNGTGVWREVTVSQTGPVSLLKPRIVTDYTGNAVSRVTATINIVVKNSGATSVKGKLKGSVDEPSGANIPVSTSYTLKANEAKTITLKVQIKDPQIWWPKAWGDQPLYSLNLAAYIGSEVSDRAAQRTFGIRHVTSSLNSHGDRAFAVNGHPFLVTGAGYSADMFLRFEPAKLVQQFEYILDMGQNTVRLEGKQEHPELYDIADRMGMMVLTGWECCDKWEGWTYNDEAQGVKWVDADYVTAERQMEHEAYMMQGHACLLGFLVGSDFWPDERASPMYVNKLKELDWDVPIIASASMRGFPENLGSSGMKMEGPYDWVPPNYWYDTQYGAAFGFGSELGSGVGTPELSSLKKFLTESDMDDLWTAPDKGLYHMSTIESSFYDRKIYNNALYSRYGAPTSLDDYLLKSQAMDYEATRSEFEAYSALQSAKRPSTGIIYWMLNNAWPSLHWNLFDYYLKPAGSYFGAKVGGRAEHVAFEYGSAKGNVWLINHTLDKKGSRNIKVDLLSKDGKTLFSRSVDATTTPNHSQKVTTVPKAATLKEAAFLRLVLSDAAGEVLSRNVYWLSPKVDKLDWDNSTWFYTPVTEFASYKSLATIKPAKLRATAGEVAVVDGKVNLDVTLENKAAVVAYFVRLELRDGKGEDVLPVLWSDNYVTLWPGEKVVLNVSWAAGGVGSGEGKVDISGINVGGVKAVVVRW
ncbi:hypothetical protein V493_01304 [Pseudogymnoascus sp. VKM F-4281 (FW-2241)]|nr:hypothetical protein V493_01304 [Pseudogymnoascus sp. VKM F-4281 (FW-2241)]